MKLNEDDEKTEQTDGKSEGGKESDNRVKVKLVELGPRLDMSIKKIEEGFLKGNVIYHSIIKKSKKEIQELMKKINLKNKLKKQRKSEQDKNVKVKEKEEEAKLTDEQRAALKLKNDNTEAFLKRKKRREEKEEKEDAKETTMSKIEHKEFMQLKKGKKKK